MLGLLPDFVAQRRRKREGTSSNQEEEDEGSVSSRIKSKNWEWTLLVSAFEIFRKRKKVLQLMPQEFRKPEMKEEEEFRKWVLNFKVEGDWCFCWVMRKEEEECLGIIIIYLFILNSELISQMLQVILLISFSFSSSSRLMMMMTTTYYYCWLIAKLGINKWSGAIWSKWSVTTLTRYVPVLWMWL